MEVELKGQLKGEFDLNLIQEIKFTDDNRVSLTSGSEGWVFKVEEIDNIKAPELVQLNKLAKFLMKEVTGGRPKPGESIVEGAIRIIKELKEAN